MFGVKSRDRFRLLIDENLYKQHMADLDNKLQSLKFGLNSYSSLPEKNSTQASSKITSLLENIEASLCQFASPSQLQADTDKSITDGQFVYLAPFMNLHLSVMLERNKVYRAFSPVEQNDKANKAEFLGAVNAYYELMSSSYAQNLKHRSQQISPVGGEVFVPDQYHTSTNFWYYDYADSFQGNSLCRTMSEREHYWGPYRRIQTRTTCYTNALSVAQSCHNAYVSAHIKNAETFWNETLLAPAAAWKSKAQALSDKILPDAVKASSYSFATVCSGASHAFSNSTVMV